MNLKKTAICSALALSVAALVTAAHAGGKPTGGSQGASPNSPGQQMQNAITSTAPGASEYAPGTKMRDAATSTPPGKLKEPGASGYAPGEAVSKDKK